MVGGGVYFDSELFTEEDVVLLNNKDKYPVTFSMTCFVGHFDNPEMASLSEDLMKAEDKGIVAHFWILWSGLFVWKLFSQLFCI